MNTKLTLKLDKATIKRAKSYAKKTDQSLSYLVENYFKLISEKENFEPDEISALVEELSGIIDLSEDFDYMKEYHDYIMEKYS